MTDVTTRVPLSLEKTMDILKSAIFASKFLLHWDCSPLLMQFSYWIPFSSELKY
ncbi:hypothetical protein C1H46_034833 [Malus baccata]|uniref:Uncharacterized protein n=1 Tax=Malus baccata TaxID=106549 RepID=A0A540KZG2_MALBA|nr:hypothetical protein C1H46_034833 [Malus baccata]